MSAQDVVNAIVLGSIYSLFATGLTLSWGVLGVVNLAHGAIFMFGGLFAYVITQHTSLSLIIVLPAAMLACATVAILLEQLAYRPIRQRSRSVADVELASLIASVAAAAILEAIADRVTDINPRSLPPSLFTILPTSIFGVRVSNLQIVIVIVSVALGVGLRLFVKTTRTGRALRAVASDRYTCELLGISGNRMTAGAMAVSGGLAGIAGVLLALDLNIVTSTDGDNLMLKAFAILILAGVGSVGGAIFGAYLLAFIETFAAVNLSTNFSEAVAFMLIIVFLLARPQGLFGARAWTRA